MKKQHLFVSQEGPFILYDDMHSGIGYLTHPAAEVTAETVNFMIKVGKGLVYLCVTSSLADKLRLREIGDRFNQHDKTVTVSIDHHEVTTGISASERAFTIKACMDPDAKPEDFQRPGHIFPIISKDRKMLERAGIAEAAVFAANQCAYACEILDETGNIADKQTIDDIKETYDLPMILFSELVSMQYDEVNWLKVRNKESVGTADETWMYTVHNELENSDCTIYMKKETNKPERIVFYKTCQLGDMLGTNQCSCEYHFADHYHKLCQHHIGALVVENDDAVGNAVIKRQMTALIKHLAAESKLQIATS
ncbi:3,4-dihydroxy-2-butanone-4-phosphate synthase [Alteribacillus sp. YIM 98480]|uniref:3,4-dihydroxy-2-butanone-4-phosphate synthase n=1 Tax=Alteribacillus sp. YIM 98480 TaxID=2606599 RepID=UPI00131BEDFD|nr:3,4-dihydroxy-2-butanone-4-phosphate synthase [Alteribacillus sp. YIM 98480]